MNTKKEINRHLGPITNKLLSGSVLNRDNLNVKEYEILSNNFKFFEEFYRRNFSLELLLTSGNYQMRKVSKSSPIGLGNMAKKEDYVFFALIMGELVEFERDNTFYWSQILNSANKKYSSLFDDYISAKDLYRYGRAAKKYLLDNNHQFIELTDGEISDSEDEEAVYALIKEINSNDFNPIDLEKYYIKQHFKEKKDIRNTVAAISQFLLLNGYMDADNAPKLYPILIYDEVVRQRVYQTFERLNYDNEGYVLVDLGNAHALCYIGDLNFPKYNESTGVLFLEIVTRIKDKKYITQGDLKALCENTLTYKDRKMVQNNFNSIFKDVLEKLIYFGFLKITDTKDTFEVTGFCKHINAYYTKEDKEGILNSKNKRRKDDGQMSFA